MKPIQVLIVDDSAAMRRLIAAAVSADPDMVVAGEAANAFEARHAVTALQPDVVTLDVEMPGQSGVEFLAELMRTRPTPVIMVAGDGTGADVRARALALGAAEFVAKPRMGTGAHAELGELARKVKTTALRGARRPAPRPEPGQSAWNGAVVGVGASAGGVEALGAFCARLTADCPPMLVVQHIPSAYVAAFAERLDRAGPASVSVAADGDALAPGRLLVAPGERHLTVCGRPGELRVRLDDGPPIGGFRPSIDVLFRSLACCARSRAVGVLLSGLGRDGVDGLLALRQAGGRTFAQEPGPTGAFGMPQAAREAGAVERQGSPERIAAELCALGARSLSGAR